MHIATLALKTLLLTAAVSASGLQFAGIDSLSAPRGMADSADVVQLPAVLVSVPRIPVVAAIERLPQVVVVGQRSGTATTAQARRSADAASSI